MKSLNFNKVSFQTQDVLSRTQMKNIMGGHGGNGMQCICKDDHSAGMESCDNCDGYCIKHRDSREKSCD